MIQFENDADSAIVKIGLIDETDDPFEVSIYLKVTNTKYSNFSIFAFLTKFNARQICKMQDLLITSIDKLMESLN